MTERIQDAGTLWELIERRAERSGSAVMLLDDTDNEVTFAGYRDRCERLAAGLHAQGIRRASRVAWKLATRIDTMVLMGALARIGALQAPIIAIYRERETAAAIATAGCDVVLGPEDPLPEQDDLTALPTPPTDPDEVRWVFFTSGSTGTPKGARHTDRSLLAAGTGFALRGRLGDQPDEVAAVGFPLGHIGGAIFLIAMLSGGFGAVLVERFVPGPSAALMRRHRVTMSGGSTVFYSALLAEQRRQPGVPLVPTLRLLKGGGAPCPPELFHTVRAEMGVTVAHDYGMTEAPMIGVADPLDEPDVLAHTDGKPVPGVQARIAAPDGSEMAAGADGEVQVHGAVLCHGYTDPSLNPALFTADGWLRTGDLGRLYPSGHLEVTGRLKDIIIRKGENIAPQEVEELLATHPAVAEVAVIGLPDPGLGERVCAVVAPAPGSAAPSLDEIAEHLIAAGIMRQKIPEQLEVLDPLPRTGLGKIAKHELRARYGPSSNPSA